MKKAARPSLLIAVGLVAFAVIVEAQQPVKMQRIGILRTGSAPDAFVDAFRQGLRDLGYVEGKNISIEYRWAEGQNERLPALATELVRLKVDVIVAAGPGPILAAKQATSRIPIVAPVVVNPVGSGLVESLARPGGNLTGFAAQTDELPGKWLELLKEVLPKLSRVAILLDPTNDVGQLKASEQTARALNLGFHVLKVAVQTDFRPAFEAARASQIDAILILPSAFLYAHRMSLTQLAVKHRLPTIHNQSDWVIGAGGLISYGPSFPDMFRRAAGYVDKILKGAKAGELPVQQPTKFELVINLKTAKQIGLTIPPNVLARADKVIK
jgi:putative ABC transport system substrate-binding protein